MKMLIITANSSWKGLTTIDDLLDSLVTNNTGNLYLSYNEREKLKKESYDNIYKIYKDIIKKNNITINHRGFITKNIS